ncbi:MAG: MBL fold metallo-hydrolase [Endomicrobiales bacterium]|nr:MBL fold metallo-hydrolase [Endomicrobiales bacterium]
MEIKIIFDKNSLNGGYSTGWGISYLVNNNILFDTGEDWQYLSNNFRIMGVDISNIEKVVISHNHWDHANGLWELLNSRQGLEVFVCSGFGREFRDKVNKLNGKLEEVNKIRKLDENIFVTGEITGEYKSKYMPEQAMVLQTDNGISVLTGCAHPGIVDMLYLVKRHFPNKRMYFVGGGFHLMDKHREEIENVVNGFKELGVQKVGPSHCTGDYAESMFKKHYGNNFINLKVGRVIEV